MSDLLVATLKVFGVGAITALMEFCRLGWHGRWRKNRLLLLGQLSCAAGLGCLAMGDQWWVGVIALVCVLTTYLSYLTLDGPWQSWRPKHKWDRWHVLLSGPSALPIQVLAAVMAALALWPLAKLAFAGAVGFNIYLAAQIKFTMWQHPELRPDHWAAKEV